MLDLTVREPWEGVRFYENDRHALVGELAPGWRRHMAIAETVAIVKKSNAMRGVGRRIAAAIVQALATRSVAVVARELGAAQRALLAAIRKTSNSGEA